MAQIDMIEGDSGELSCESFSDYEDDDEFSEQRKFRSSLFDTPELFHPHINRKSIGIKRTSNVYDRLYRISKKHPKPMLESPTPKQLTGSHPGSRLFASSKQIARKACKKADLPSETVLNFSPEIIRDSALPNSRYSMPVEDWLMRANHPKAKTTRHIEDFSFKPQINHGKPKVYTKPKTKLFISQKMAQNINCSTPRGSYKNFLKRVSSAINQHDSELETLRKSIYPEYDRETGQPWFYPVTNSKRRSLAIKSQDKDGKDHDSFNIL